MPLLGDGGCSTGLAADCTQTHVCALSTCLVSLTSLEVSGAGSSAPEINSFCVSHNPYTDLR